MSLSSGSRLGAYEVLSAIGAGGMGEVYRARDSRLNRDVALKVLPEIFARWTPSAWPASSAKRRCSRRSITRTSPLLYGLEESHGVRALVMELVEGPTLAQQLKSGPLAVVMTHF